MSARAGPRPRAGVVALAALFGLTACDGATVDPVSHGRPR